MKRSKPKLILLSLVIGLVCTLTSLLYQRPVTVEIFNHCNSSGSSEVIDNGMNCAMWHSKTTEVMMRGFPFGVIETDVYDSTTDIDILGTLGNWAIYSTLSFVALLFWRKNKIAQN